MRTLVAVLLLLAVPLAGCTGAPAEDPVPDTPDPSDELPSGNTSSPGTGPDGDAHVHDRWDVRSRAVVFDGTVATRSPRAIDPGRQGAENLWCAAFCSAFAFFRPDDGRIVPPGTERVVVEASWQPSSVQAVRPEQVEMAHMPANAAQWTILNARTEPGNWTIDTTVEMADGGHAQTSLWRFVLYVHRDAEARTLPRAALDEMEFDVTVTAERAPGELPLEPPHPDWWANGTRRTVATTEDQGTAVGAGEWYAGTAGFGCCRPYKWWRTDEHEPIPPGTEAITVRINRTSDTSLPSAVQPTPWVYAQDGSQLLYERWEPTASNGTSWLFVRPISDRQTDGMYAEARSRWAFMVGFEGETRAADEPFLGTSVTNPYLLTGSYDVQIQAVQDLASLPAS